MQQMLAYQKWLDEMEQYEIAQAQAYAYKAHWEQTSLWQSVQAAAARTAAMQRYCQRVKEYYSRAYRNWQKQIELQERQQEQLEQQEAQGAQQAAKQNSGQG